ncbi:MAG: MotA/TolQ/ExbB proton channel family protein [Planctomycetota bacterium]|nr:MAG: MotA/TolQ/ExbB proton channel family protein [Planctomycetota bacterium]
MNFLIQALHLSAHLLFLPVILGLLGMLVWSFLELGGVLREYRQRRKWRPIWQMEKFDAKNTCGFVQKFLVLSKEKDKNIQKKIFSDLEIRVSNCLSRLNFCVRLAPMLGLMGTLIPLGPALWGLSQGNLQALIHNITIAFSTTVIGLAVGGMTYGMYLVRKKWYLQDLSDIEFLLEGRDV